MSQNFAFLQLPLVMLLKIIIKIETLAQMFSCEICKIFKNTFFIEPLQWLSLISKMHLWQCQLSTIKLLLKTVGYQDINYCCKKGSITMADRVLNKLLRMRRSNHEKTFSWMIWEKFQYQNIISIRKKIKSTVISLWLYCTPSNSSTPYSRNTK